jgi:DUF4097 and DUF4098 domain-containing protein YvlB
MRLTPTWTAAAVVASLMFAGPARSAPLGDMAQKETEQVDRNYPFQSGGELRLKNFSGRIHITGADRANVVVHAVRKATRDRLDHIQLDIQATSSQISIEANKKDSSWESDHDNVVETDFDIEVPLGTKLDVHAFSSDLYIQNVEARQKLYSFSGTIRVEDAAGPLEAETFSGDIKADLTKAATAPAVEMKTFSGDIEVKLSSSAQGRLDFSSFSGSLDTSMPMVYKTGNRRRVQAELGGGGAANELRFHTFSGDVRLR